MTGTLNFDILLRDHIDGYRRLGWNGWCENLKPIVTNLKKLSPKNRVSRGLKSIVVHLKPKNTASNVSTIECAQRTPVIHCVFLHHQRSGHPLKSAPSYWEHAFPSWQRESMRLFLQSWGARWSVINNHWERNVKELEVTLTRHSNSRTEGRGLSETG